MEVLVVCAGGGVAKTPALCVQRSAFGLAWSRSVRASAPAVERTLVCAACVSVDTALRRLAAARGAQVHPQDGMEEFSAPETPSSTNLTLGSGAAQRGVFYSVF